MEEKSPGLQHRVTWMLVSSVICAVLGSLQVGYHSGNLNSPHSLFEQFFIGSCWTRYGKNISPQTLTILWSVTVSILYFGAFISAHFASRMANKFGRRTSIVVTNAFSLTSALLMGSCKAVNSIEMLILGRFLMGLFCGLTMTLTPLYIQELSPTRLRGAFSTIHPLAFTIGICIGQVTSLESVLGTEKWWPLMLSMSAVPGIVQIVTLPLCPESPHYLFINCKREAEAVMGLQRLRGTSDVWEEVEDLWNEVTQIMRKQEVTLCQLFTQYKKPVSRAFIITACTQLSGCSGINYYSTKMLHSAGLPHAQEIALSLGLINIIAIILCALLVKKAGRKTLLMVGQVALAACNIMLVVSGATLSSLSWMKYLLLVALYLLVFAYQIGPGPISSYIAAELFIPAVRPMAMAVTSSWTWLMKFIIVISFQSLMDSLGPYIYVIFATVQVAAALYTGLFYAETKEDHRQPKPDV